MSVSERINAGYNDVAGRLNISEVLSPLISFLQKAKYIKVLKPPHTMSKNY